MPLRRIDIELHRAGVAACDAGEFELAQALRRLRRTVEAVKPQPPGEHGGQQREAQPRFPLGAEDQRLDHASRQSRGQRVGDRATEAGRIHAHAAHAPDPTQAVAQRRQQPFGRLAGRLQAVERMYDAQQQAQRGQLVIASFQRHGEGGHRPAPATITPSPPRYRPSPAPRSPKSDASRSRLPPAP